MQRDCLYFILFLFHFLRESLSQSVSLPGSSSNTQGDNKRVVPHDCYFTRGVERGTEKRTSGSEDVRKGQCNRNSFLPECVLNTSSFCSSIVPSNLCTLPLLPPAFFFVILMLMEPVTSLIVPPSLPRTHSNSSDHSRGRDSFLLSTRRMKY